MYLWIEIFERDGVKLFDLTVPIPDVGDTTGLARRPLDVYCRVTDEPSPWPGCRGTIAGLRSPGDMADPEPPRAGYKYGGVL